MKYVVKNRAGDYLQDRGSLPVPGCPGGDPGEFGPRRTAYVFTTSQEAVKASEGLLGPGRNCVAEAASVRAPGTQTLDDFVEEMKKDLDKFAANWREENKVTPENWPLEMGGPDWYEHFSLFESFVMSNGTDMDSEYHK